MSDICSFETFLFIWDFEAYRCCSKRPGKRGTRLWNGRRCGAPE